MNKNPSFRIWNGKEYLKGPELDNLSIGISGEGVLLTENNELVYPDEKYIIQQSTELFDKNGKEIFEGDVIIFMGKWDEKGNVMIPDYESYVVNWQGGGFHAFPTSIKKQMDSSGKCVLGVGHTDNEIIGNIFENPELCKDN